MATAPRVGGDAPASAAPAAPVGAADHPVTLREITADTVAAILALEVAPGQRPYVASNSKSIAQAHFEPAAWFRAIYAADEPVGFTMLFDPTRAVTPGASSICWLWRLMIDERFQGSGYGSAAVRLLIAHAKPLAGVAAFRVSYVPGPGDAGVFYRRLGFHDTGEIDHGEVVLEIDLAHHG